MLGSGFPSPPRSKKGFFGAVLFFYAAVRIIFDVWQGADFAMSNADTLMGNLATGPGNLVALVVGVFLIVWAILSQRSQSEPTDDVPKTQQVQQSTDAQNAASQPAPADTDSRQEEVWENQRFGRAAVVRETDERPLVGDDELGEKTYERRSFWMGEFARKTAPSGEAQAIIRDRRFYDCHIYGPVIFGPLSADEIDKVFIDCEWLEDQDVVSWPLAESRQEYIGAVRLEDCRFEGCRLSRVGLLRQEESPPVEQLRTQRDQYRKVSEQAQAERDDQLKARCFDLSDQLLEFLEDLKREYPQTYHNETMPRYEQRLVGNVTRIIQALKQRGWWHPVGARRLENPLQWEDLHSLADYLRAIGLGQLY